MEEQFQTISIDQVALAMSIIALAKDAWPNLNKIKTTLLAIVVCVGVYYGVPYVPAALYSLFVAVAVPLGVWSMSKTLAEKAGGKPAGGPNGN